MSGRPLRICFVAYRGNMRCGGQGIYLWFLARELARLGHEIHVVVGPPYPDDMPFAASVERLENQQFWGGWFSKRKADVLPWPEPLRALTPLNFYEMAASRIGFLPEPFAFSARAFRAVARRVRAGERFDIVHDVQCLGWGMLGIRALGLPIVTTVHHPLTVDRRFSFVRDESFTDAFGTMAFYPVGMQSAVARRVERLFTSSAASAGEIVRGFGVAPERIAMVANGVDTELFSPDPAVRRNEQEILCVGRASDPNKGVRLLVDALDRMPRDVRLTLVDEDEPGNVARLRARELGCEDRIDLVGRVSTEELVHLYRRAALVVVPSRYEGFGLPAAEAMACGTPVVATRAGALPEVVGPGGGVVVPREPEALARAVVDLLARPASRDELGRQGRKRIESAYAWPRVAEATAEVYREVLAARGRPASTTTSANAGPTLASASRP